MHLIDAKDLNKTQIETLFELAENYKAQPWQTEVLKHKIVSLLFFENSTRTRCSFEIAAKRLGAAVLNLDLAASSMQKDESLLDTIQTLEAMDVDAFVVRHKEEDTCRYIVDNLKTKASVLNAGSGTQTHPSQALLDAFTIYERKPDFENLSIAIVGDIRHSRVAHSNIHFLKVLGVKDLRLVGPEIFLPKQDLDCKTYTDFGSGIKDADVVMVLRIQKERMADTDVPDAGSYFKNYGLTPEKLKLAKPDAIVMHPGPMNRGVEISTKVADGSQSIILQQVQNGVFMRQALLDWLVK